MRAFLHDTRGVAFVEFGLILPLLVALFVGGYEVSRYVLLSQKLDRATQTVADVVTQEKDISSDVVEQLFGAMDTMLSPQSFSSGSGTVILSMVKKDGTNPAEVIWQYRMDETSTLQSKVGPPCLTATLPANFTMVDDEGMIVAEVYYTYRPFFTLTPTQPKQLYKVSYYRPRLGALDAMTVNMLHTARYTSC